MQRHRFDPISFVFGLGFTAAASWALLSDGNLDLLDGRWVWPVLLLLGGALLLSSVVKKGGPAPSPDPFVTSDDAAGESDAALVEAAKAELPEDPFSRPGS